MANKQTNKALPKQKAATSSPDNPVDINELNAELLRLNELLIQKEMALQVMVNTTKDLMWSVDNKICLVTANNNFLQMAELVSGVKIKPGDTVCPLQGYSNEQTEFWSARYTKVLQGETFSEEILFTEPYEAWGEISFNPIIEHGKIIGAACFSRDITVAKRREEALVKSERLMADAQRVARFGSWERTLSQSKKSDDILVWSSEVYNIFGYEKGSIEPTVSLFFSCVHPEDRAKLQAVVAKAINLDERIFMDYRIIRPDGEIRWVRTDAQVIYDKSTGKAIKLIGVVKDITERKVAEIELVKSRANLQTIFDTTDTAYTLLDANLDIIMFNRRAKEMVEKVFKKPLVAGENYINYFPNGDIDRARRLLKRVFGGENASYERYEDAPDGGSSWYDVRLNGVTSDDGIFLGVCIATVDVTKRKTEEIEKRKLSDDLLKRNEHLEQFSYIISHDLRGPVVRIMGLMNILLSSPDEIDKETQDFLFKELHETAKSIDIIIHDLNDILNIKNQLAMPREAIDFNELVEDIKSSITKQIEQHNAIITTQFQEPTYYAVKSYMQSVFYNLITNAIKYRKPEISPVIDISSQIADGGITIVFKDNGVGIDLGLAGQKIFGLYKRFHTHVDGSGLGLYMCKTQIELIGGKIMVDSVPNCGAVFTIWLPITDIGRIS